MRSTRRPAAVLSGFSLVIGGLSAAALAGPAAANPTGTSLVISEVYGGGGNSGAEYTNDFIELYNPTGDVISVDDMRVEYFSSSGNSGGSHDLTGSVPPGGSYLIQEAKGSGGTTALPDPDASGTLSMSGTRGSVELTRVGSVVDLVGYGDASRCEGSCAPGLENDTSDSRVADGTDTDDNAADFTDGEPSPGKAQPAFVPPTVEDASIAQIQGTGFRSPYADKENTYARTRGVITAAYPTGGFYSFVIQTAGTGSDTDQTPGASDALWVVREPHGFEDEIQIGALVEVTGPVTEEFGRTELSYDPADEYGDLTFLDEAHAPVTPLEGDYPTTSADREAHESELLDVSGQQFTVTDNYSTNRFGEVGLATGDRPLISPTEVADAQDEVAVDAVQDENFARGVILDDGASWDYLDSRNQDEPLPWLSPANTVRVGAPAAVTGPVVLDYGFGAWRFQPTSQVTDEGHDVATFGDTRPDNLQPQDVGGDLTIATFNVLNYFNTTGMEFEDAGGKCSYYEDRDGDPVTDNRCTPDGPRGAAEDEDLARQQVKIVKAINALDADVVSLEEIENSVKLLSARDRGDRDDALKALVAALNQDAGSQRWAFAPSPPPSRLPELAEQDVIRTAFIYDPSTVKTLGPSRVLLRSEAFANAREPLAQAFKPLRADDDQAFAVIVNHFKSKGSPCAEDEDDVEVPGEELQGNCNQDRVAQARALVDFVDEVKAEREVEKVYLTGDFNSYSMEDPIQVLEDAGFTNLMSDTADEWSYSFDGQSGSLDHVLANEAALGDVVGVDIWEINANEAVAYEYSRHNYNVTDFYAPDVFRASDHNPELVGLDVG